MEISMNPSLEMVQTYLEQNYSVPVMMEFMADLMTPVNLFLGIRQRYDNCFLLESAENGEQFGRYSFIGFHPHIKIKYFGGRLVIEENGEVKEQATEDPFAAIDEIIKKNKSPIMEGMPKFTGGLVGYFGYDTVRYVEKTVNRCPEDDMGLPEISLMGCRELIVFDHLKHRMMLITNIGQGSNPLEKRYEEAGLRLQAIYKEIEEILAAGAAPINKGSSSSMAVSTLISKEKFMANVNKARAYIRDGDIFQVVLSQRFDIANPPDPFNVFRMLRAGNPSPYMYYLGMDGMAVVGSSPEMLVSLEGDMVTTHPIAGTIRRGADLKEDAVLERQLLNDAKEMAEHTMLVDLGRNDIGKISRFGSVNVTKFMEVEKYSKLMHLVSNVTGTVREGMGPVDALKAVLPAGTLSGAPKVRAMQIIDALEARKRGIYGGAIGYIGYNGVLDTCIAIRTAVFKGQKAYVQAGGGIVADSIPEKEYEEAGTKAAAVLTAIEKAGEM